MTTRTLLPFLFLLTACEPMLTPGGIPVERARTCEETLELAPRAVAGHVVDGVFEPLADGSPLAVHSGSQGGFHSDLVIRLEGPGADVDGEWGAVELIADVTPGGWTESQSDNLHAWCQDLGDPGYYHDARIFWNGAGDGWDEDSLSWSEMASQQITVELVVETDAFVGADAAFDVALRQGQYEDDGGDG